VGGGNSSKGRERVAGTRPSSPRLLQIGLRAGRLAAQAVRSRGAEGEGFEKRGEPQDRLRDATSPRSFAQRKPSRWCETTGAERELDGWCRRPEGVSGQLGALGVDALKSRRWRGRQVANPKRGRASVPGLSFGSGRRGREGPGPCADASKEMEDHGVPMTGLTARQRGSR
jgi:hypothetical protein